MSDENQEQSTLGQQESPTEKLLREKREAAAKPPVVESENLDREETPSDLLKTDGSSSPHDVTSEGGSRQAAAHEQVKGK